MSASEPEVVEKRDKRTRLLLAGGAVSLVLPLLGLVYIKLSEAKTAHAPNSSVMFDRRENGDAKVNVSQSVAILAPPAAAQGQSSLPIAGGQTMAPAAGGSSLDFVKGGTNNTYYQDKAAPAVSTQAAPAAPAPQPAPEPVQKTVAAKKGGKKAFNMPKLNGTKSFSGNFKSSSPKPTGGKGMAGVADPQAKGGGDMADMLKNVPGGADNPDLQKYLKTQGK